MTRQCRTAQHDPVELLLGTYLCGDLTPAEVAPFARGGRPRTYRPGESVFRVGEPATELFVVASGHLKECVVTPEGDEYVSELFWPVAVFGEPGLFAPERDRVVTVTARESSVVLGFRRVAVVEFLLRHPTAMMRTLEAMTAMTRELSDTTVALGHSKIRERLAAKISELAEQRGVPHSHGVRIDAALSQSLLASLISASRPNVNRALAEIIAAGHLVLVGRDYVVPDPAGLRAAYGARPTPLYRRNATRARPL